MDLHATLYLPHQPPRVVPSEELVLPDPATGFASVPPVVFTLLGCASSQVDVLACAPHYVVYTIFDSEKEANPEATQAVSELMGFNFNTNNEDELLRGPVLLVK